MWKRLTVHSVLRYLFVSQWCTLRSSVAAKQPSATEPLMIPVLCRSQKLLHQHFFSLLQTLLASAYHFLTTHLSRSWNFKKINLITQPSGLGNKISRFELSWEHHNNNLTATFAIGSQVFCLVLSLLKWKLLSIGFTTVTHVNKQHIDTVQTPKSHKTEY